MGKSPCADFYARFLGEYSLTYYGRSIQLQVNMKSKAAQLFLKLLKAGDRGLDMNDLLQTDGGTQLKDINNFRQRIYFLRREIERSDFPPGRYIVREKARYYFSKQYRVETDTGYLDSLLVSIREGLEKTSFGDDGPDRGMRNDQPLLMEFCRHYVGEFLPMLSDTEWAAAEAAYYRKWYFYCLVRLCGMLKDQGEYETILKFCSAARRMYPYDDKWLVTQIDCLMLLHRYDEAQEVYEDAARFFDDEFGVAPIEQVMGRGEGGRKVLSIANTHKIKEGLKEWGKPHGAYECSFTSFVDIYHIIARNAGQPGMEGVVLIAELDTDSARQTDGRSCGEGETQERLVEEWEMVLLRQTIRKGVRKSDVYTRCGQNRYLVLLIGADGLGGEKAAQRLERQWKENSGAGRAKLSFTVCAVEGPEPEGNGNEEESDICSTYDQPEKCHMAGADNLAGGK